MVSPIPWYQWCRRREARVRSRDQSSASDALVRPRQWEASRLSTRCRNADRYHHTIGRSSRRREIVSADASTLPDARTPTAGHSHPAISTPMSARIDYRKVSPEATRAMAGLERFTHASGLETGLLELVKLRASYINGCAYCVDVHTKDARAGGETEQRLYAIPVWRETPFFTPRERAALAWTESVTDVARTGVPDDAYEQARTEFSESELLALTMAIIAINGWTRLAVSFRTEPGT